MKIEVSEDVLLKTKCCKGNNLCLHGELNNCCKIKDCINGQIHFIELIARCYCNNQMSFGDSCFCICPIRKEIFNKYGL